MKTCTNCGEQKPLGEFYKHASGCGGKRARCKACDNAAAHRYRSANGEACRQRRRNGDLRKLYGLTPEQLIALTQKQGNRCAICGEETRLCVDHCHATGRVRGLLCATCNAALGLLRDNPVLMRSAANYLLGTR